MFSPYSVRAVRFGIPGSFILLAVLLVGCGGIGTLKADTVGPSDGESILVVGVQPPDHGVMFFPGTIEDGKFKPAPSTGFIDTVISDVPRDGYVVARARAGQQLALTVVNAPKSGGQGGQFHACGGTLALVVEVPKARVAYVADIDFAPQGSKLNVRYGTQLEAARDHLRKNFPKLKGDVELLPSKLLPTANECVNKTSGIPNPIIIYIRR